MSVKVNPPPRPRLPREWVANNEIRAWTEQLQTIVFQLYRRTGGNNDDLSLFLGRVQDLESQINTLSPNLQQVMRELEGLPNVTIDTTGFTIDTTKQTIDKTVV